MRFLYTDSMQIKALIVENAQSFYMTKGKKIMFGIAGRIFNY